MPRKRSHPERGATLVESLVAISLFALCSASLGTLLTQHIRHQSTNRRATTAIALAEQDLENMRALEYEDISSHTTSPTVDLVTYKVETKVTADSPAAGMKHIVTTVTWSEPIGPQAYAVHAIYTAVKR